MQRRGFLASVAGAVAAACIAPVAAILPAQVARRCLEINGQCFEFDSATVDVSAPMIGEDGRTLCRMVTIRMQNPTLSKARPEWSVAGKVNETAAATWRTDGRTSLSVTLVET